MTTTVEPPSIFETACSVQPVAESGGAESGGTPDATQSGGTPDATLRGEDLNYRSRKLSPWEQYEKKLLSVLPPEDLPDSVIALLLHKQFRETVTAKGEIHLTHLGKPYKFWHLDSVTCRRVGEEIFFSWDPEQPEFIYVIDREKKQFVETVPAKNLVAWFSYDQNARDEIAVHRTFQKQVHADLSELQRPTTAAELERITDNSKKLRATVVFEVPRLKQSSDTLDATNNFAQPNTTATPRAADNQADQFIGSEREDRPVGFRTEPTAPRFSLAEEIAHAAKTLPRQIQQREREARQTEDDIDDALTRAMGKI